MSQNWTKAGWIVGVGLMASTAMPAWADKQKPAPARKPAAETAASSAPEGQYLYFRPATKAPPAGATVPTLDVGSLSSFTPSTTDSRQPVRTAETPAAVRKFVPSPARAQVRQASVGFTPSGRANDPRALSFVLSSQVIAEPPASLELGRFLGSSVVTTSATAYNVGLAVGYKGFSVEAGVNRLTEGTKPLAQGLDIGLSYRGQDWKTSLQLGGREFRPDPLFSFGRFDPDRSYSVELGGAYRITSWMSLSGGMRYAISYGRPVYGFTIEDPHQTNASVYLGSAFSF
jgi:hypothetical protein